METIGKNLGNISYSSIDKAQKMLKVANKKYSDFTSNCNVFGQKGYTLMDGNIYILIWQDPLLVKDKRESIYQKNEFVSHMRKKYESKVLLDKNKSGTNYLVLYISQEKLGELITKEVL